MSVFRLPSITFLQLPAHIAPSPVRHAPHGKPARGQSCSTTPDVTCRGGRIRFAFSRPASQGVNHFRLRRMGNDNGREDDSEPVPIHEAPPTVPASKDREEQSAAPGLFSLVVARIRGHYGVVHAVLCVWRRNELGSGGQGFRGVGTSRTWSHAAECPQSAEVDVHSSAAASGGRQRWQPPL
jgi:hypothetical protein